MTDPRYLSRSDAARYLSISTRTLDRWLAQGLIPPPRRIGGRVIYDRLALDAAMEPRRATS